MSVRIPATASSIPTKYQTVFIPTSEKNGFNSRSLRFSSSLTQNENPGPGTYNVGRTPADINSVSLSKKGTGGFPSKASSTYCHPNNNVAAHASFVSKTKRDLLKPNAVNGPSPCHYTINDSLVKESTKVLVSCFKSKTSRNSLNVISDNPGPASYDLYKSFESEKKTIFP
ncbi:hypothetical protein XENTR_v10005847 [Xenopus tropicalis]|nr:hypothetical protein XENTR_v10005847 [Xenopus tropicalis]